MTYKTTINKEYYIKNRAYILELAKKRRNSGIPRPCLHCGTIFYVKHGRYCSVECSNRAKRGRGVSHICLNCGDEFKGGKNRKYCSRGCFIGVMATERIERIDRKCLCCGASFTVKISSIRKYCSRKCFGISVKKVKKSSICKECGVVINYGKSFCSSDCAIKNSKVTNIISCDNCGKKFNRIPSRVSDNYNCCSRECMWKYLRKINRGIKKRKKKKLINPLLRWEVFERDGFKCIYCNATREDGIKLHIDHFIPESRNGATDIGNLVTACEDCNLGKYNKLTNIKLIKGL